MPAAGGGTLPPFESSCANGGEEEGGGGESTSTRPFLRGMGVYASKLIVLGHGMQIHSVEEIDDREPRIINMFPQQTFESGVWFLVRLTDYPSNQLHPFDDRDRLERACMLAEFNGAFFGIVQVVQVVCHGGVVDLLEGVEVRNDGGHAVERAKAVDIIPKGHRW